MSENSATPEKKCSKCKILFPRTQEYFYADKRKRDGLRSCCKNCFNVQAEEWRKENPDKVQKHSEKKREATRRWRKANPERMRLQDKKWAQANPDKERASRRKWVQENPLKIWIEKHKRRARQMGAEGTFTEEDIHALYKMQNGQCCWCSAPITWKEKTIEHIRSLKRGGSNYPKNLVLICKSCNSSKGKCTLFEEWQPPQMLEWMTNHVLQALENS